MRRSLPSSVCILLSTIIIAVASSCGNDEKKADSAKDSVTTVTPADTTETGKNAKRPSEENPPSKEAPSTPANNNNNSDDILANIDQYLVSTPNFPSPPASGGIVNASVTVKNTFPDITIQKAILEVSILTTEGAEFRTDYYVLQNVEPGEMETIKIPNAARGNSIVSHIVKLKSQELTNGEMILVGHRVTAK